MTQFKRGYKAEELESKICSGVGSHDMCDIGLPLKLGSSVNDSFILIHQMVVLLQFVDQFKININSGSIRQTRRRFKRFSLTFLSETGISLAYVKEYVFTKFGSFYALCNGIIGIICLNRIHRL